MGSHIVNNIFNKKVLISFLLSFIVVMNSGCAQRNTEQVFRETTVSNANHIVNIAIEDRKVSSEKVNNSLRSIGYQTGSNVFTNDRNTFQPGMSLEDQAERHIEHKIRKGIGEFIGEVFK